MKRKLLVTPLLLIVVLASSGCVQLLMGLAVSQEDEDSTVSHGGPVEDYVSLIDSLRAAGAEVEPVGPMSQVFLSVEGQIIQVNDEDVQVYEYPDEAAADADAAQIPPDGASFRTVMVTWIAPPHFFHTGRLIVLYVGNDAEVLTALEAVLGPQFAGG